MFTVKFLNHAAFCKPKRNAAFVLLLLLSTVLFNSATAQQNAAGSIAYTLAGVWEFQRAELFERQAGSQTYTVTRQANSIAELQAALPCYAHNGIINLIVAPDQRHADVQCFMNALKQAEYRIVEVDGKVELTITETNGMAPALRYSIATDSPDTIRVTSSATCTTGEGAVVEGAVTCVLKRLK